MIRIPPPVPFVPLVLSLFLVACAGSSRESIAPDPAPGVAPDPFARAGIVTLPPREAEEHSGLHRVFRLSESIVSGGEPASDAAFAAIAAMGVRTIVSVDGKVPDAAAARRHGLRTVHVPIRYAGIDSEELLRLAKTFREPEGPFFVHCFHGRHRGPAAAAVGRLVLDGASREQALAEMRQWCGTSSKYAGLYATIADAEIPEARESAALPYDFPAAAPMVGFRQAMVEVSRSHDRLLALERSGWRLDPDHPDLDPRHEAEILRDLYRQSGELDEVKSRPAGFRESLEVSHRASEELVGALRALPLGERAASEAASRALALVGEGCASCHAAWRNR